MKLQRIHWMLVVALLLFTVSGFSWAEVVEPCQPKDNEGSYEVFKQIPEDKAVDSVIGKVEFVNYSHIYQIFETDSPVLKYNASSKSIILLKKLDYETKRKEELKIICLPVGENTLNVTITVNVIVLNVNDNAPKFTKDIYSVNLSEDTAVGKIVDCNIHATDVDDGNLQFKIISASPSNYFSIDLVSKPLLKLLKELDYETLKQLTVKILVEDQPASNQQKLNSTADVIFTVLDADDLNPMFTEPSYFATINVNSIVNTQLNILPQEIEAYDQDFTFNKTVQYSFKGYVTEFSINSQTGFIFVNSALVTGKKSYILEAKQEDNPKRVGVAILTIDILAINDTRIQFRDQMYFVHISEDSKINGRVIVNVFVEQKSNLHVFYSLENENDIFSIDDGGRIQLKKELDFEKRRNYLLRVSATNKIQTASVNVSITVTDINDNNPVVSKPDIAVMAQRVKNSIVGKLNISDPDSNSKITCRLLVHRKYFNVTESGEVIIIADSEKLQQQTYNLLIMVDDGGNPPRSTLAKMNISFSKYLKGSVNIGGVTGDDTLVIVLGVSLVIFIVLVILLIIYISRRVQKTSAEDDSSSTRWFFRELSTTENLEKAKPSNSKDLKGIAFKPTYSEGRVNENFSDEDSFDGGDTSVQVNPFETIADIQQDEKAIEAGSIASSVANSPSNGFIPLNQGLSVNSLYSTHTEDRMSPTECVSEAPWNRSTLTLGSSNEGFDSARSLIDEKPEITVYF